MFAWGLWSVFACTTSSAADDVGAVMLATGEVSLRDAAGAVRPAAPGAPVRRDDTVVTGEGGVVVLHLRNDQLVRIDEDLQLSVGRIVVLDAPRATASPSEQLRSLVDPTERTAFPGFAAAERVAGWDARLTAAEAPGAVDESAKLEEEAYRVEPAPSALPPRSRKPSSPAAPAGEPSTKNVVPSPPAVDRGIGGAAPASEPDPVVPPEQSRVVPPLSAEQVQALFRTELSGCLDQWELSLPVRIGSVGVIVRAKDGRITRVLFDGGLPVPACASAPLVGRAFGGEPAASLTFQVSIP